MNKEKKNLLSLTLLLSFLILILIQNVVVKESIILGTKIWITQVFPSLFPMFIISNLLIHYHLPEILSNSFGRFFTKIFHTSPYGIFVFVMSLLSGTPSNAFLLKELTETKKITSKEASFLLSFTFFSNPLFLINMLSLIFPSKPSIILKIILIHYFTNFLIGLILRKKENIPFKKIPILPPKEDFGTILSKSIKKTMDTLLLILGTICFYFMIAKMISLKNPFMQTLLSGFLELTQGLNQLIGLNLSISLKEILAISFISFGGLSIHTQIKSIISDTSISYSEFLKGRILHVGISICFILLF